jgi:hypothetical protein
MRRAQPTLSPTVQLTLAPPPRQIRLQQTSLAGFRHHDAPSLWSALARRARLSLAREADNPHDPNAVALLWRGRKLGYLPRGENLVAARLLDRSRRLSARIARLDPGADYNRRIGIEVLLEDGPPRADQSGLRRPSGGAAGGKSVPGTGGTDSASQARNSS